MTQADAVYHEKARSYRSIWVTVACVAAAFGVDLAIGGGLAHLIGWLLVLAVLGAFHLFVLYAVRSVKSLTVTDEEIRIGDEVIERAAVVALVADPDEDAPVLGWPGGRPRGAKLVAVRLAGGQDAVIPTRYPERLRAALGVGQAQETRPEIRAAARSELPLLEEIDGRAETLFRTAGYHLPELPFDADGLTKAKAVFVAGRQPIAFVRIDEVDGLAHIAELAVVPRWMRQGIGGALVERACEWARAHDYPAVTLTTYADVPWNGPFYAKRGFAEIDDLTPALAAIRAREGALGLDAVGRRVVMRRDV